MKLRNAILSLALGLGTLGGAIIGTTAATGLVAEPVEVGAYTDGDTYELVGSLQNYASVSWTPGEGLPITTEATIGDASNPQPAFSVEVNLVEGDQFKVVNATVTPPKWIDQTVAFEDYINGGGTSNFTVVVTGTYRITINKYIDSWGGDISSAYFFEKIEDTPSIEVSLVGADGEVARVDTTPVNVEYNPAFLFQEGYTLDGWFYDQDFLEPYTATTLTEATTLYGKWSVAPEDYLIYYEGNYTNAYYWSSATGAQPVAWPGGEMEVVERAYNSETTVKSILIQTEYQADMIIFNNGASAGQTDDLVLGSTTGVYGNTGLLEDSDVKLAALAFIDYFDGLRRDGDICYVLDDVDTFNTLKGLYEAVTDKTLVDGVTDLNGGEGVTIGQTMSMLLAREASENGNALGIVNDNNGDQTMWIVVGTILFATLVAGVALYVSKRRKTNA